MDVQKRASAFVVVAVVLGDLLGPGSADASLPITSWAPRCSPDSCTPAGLLGGRDMPEDGPECLPDDGTFGDLALHSTFEWFDLAFEPFAAVFDNLTALGRQASVLQVGCGASTLTESLYDAGYTRFTNIDIREAAVKQMRLRNADGKRPELRFLCMDARRMVRFASESFDVVLDRGMLDHFVAAKMGHERYLAEVARVLRPAGALLLVSNGLAAKRLLAAGRLEESLRPGGPLVQEPTRTLRAMGGQREYPIYVLRRSAT